MHHGCGCPLAVLAQEHFRKLAIPRARLHIEDFLLQLLTMAQQKPKSTGPEFVRNALLPLNKISVDPDDSGWREIDPERVIELYEAFYRGEFGMTLTCDVQLMDAESTGNKKLVYDGLATCCALPRIAGSQS